MKNLEKRGGRGQAPPLRQVHDAEGSHYTRRHCEESRCNRDEEAISGSGNHENERGVRGGMSKGKEVRDECFR